MEYIVRVQQIPFSWDLTMSQKLDSSGNLVGSYGIEDLESYWFPEAKRKGKRREKLRRLHYDLVWDITEIQVKVHVRALFPNQIGPRITQLAKERRLDEHERTLTGESRSNALIKDIEITKTAGLGASADSLDADKNVRRRELSIEASGSTRLQQSDSSTREHQQTGRIESPCMTSSTGLRAQLRSRNVNDSGLVSLIYVLYLTST
jgi:hypothetical protein